MKLIAFVIFSVIFIMLCDLCSSGVHLSATKKEISEENLYTELRAAKQYSATLLQFDDKTRQEICADLMYSKTITNRGILYLHQDDQEFNAMAKTMYPDALEKLNEEKKKIQINYGIKISKLKSVDIEEPLEFNFSCMALKLKDDVNIEIIDYAVINGYLNRSFFIGVRTSPNTIQDLEFAELAPRYKADWDQKKLEKFYIDMRENIEELRKIDSKTVDIIEKKDGIRTLNSLGRTTLCGSVFETKFYKDKSTEFRYGEEDVSFEEESTLLAFRSEEFIKEYYFRFTSYNHVKCTAYSSNAPQVFYVIRSFFGDASAFVLTVEEEGVYLDLHIFDVPVLLNSKARIYTT